jgi:hypothetical protein
MERRNERDLGHIFCIVAVRPDMGDSERPDMGDTARMSLGNAGE